ncbi:Flp pilus assembly pilin Flp [Methylohalomonas lacus]|uniref:Flp pilus assembly pilin Flp n=1 Tax=Methylohalomonas lacus TaxID=398773 RepID=A0AAE3HM67_9GAMM|nr:Flp pilus assembly pilin Flp [Methylohalomonas lacus]
MIEYIIIVALIAIAAIAAYGFFGNTHPGQHGTDVRKAADASANTTKQQGEIDNKLNSYTGNVSE